MTFWSNLGSEVASTMPTLEVWARLPYPSPSREKARQSAMESTFRIQEAVCLPRTEGRSMNRWFSIFF